MESGGESASKDDSSSNRRSNISTARSERCLPFVPADVRPWGADRLFGDPTLADVRFLQHLTLTPTLAFMV